MPRDTRMSRMLHVLIHMDRHVDRATSDRIARMLGTHAVVVRRMMSGLRDGGFVTSEKGHGGGWRLARPLSSITLLDVYRAIGEPSPFSLGMESDRPDCRVARAVDARLSGTLDEAEALLRARFGAITLADLAAEADARQPAPDGADTAGAPR